MLGVADDGLGATDDRLGAKDDELRETDDELGASWSRGWAWDGSASPRMAMGLLGPHEGMKVFISQGDVNGTVVIGGPGPRLL